MVRRKLLARFVSHWFALCDWFVRRAPFPPYMGPKPYRINEAPFTLR